MIWPWSKGRAYATRIGIALDEAQGGAVAVVERAGDRWRLHRAAHCPPHAAGDWPLASLASGQRCPAVAVLAPGHYQLLLVERPDVPDAEVAQAVRWRLRELINFPVDEAVVDVFDVPRQARGNRDMVYAVAAEGAAVAALAEHCNDARVALSAIDVPELCLRNIATSLAQDRFGVACLLVQDGRGVLTLTREQQLYLVRQIEVPPGVATDADAVAQVALEVQRSLDYFESHYDQRPIRDVLLAPAPGVDTFAAALGREMAVNVALLDLNELLDGARELDTGEQAACLLALGAAMRGPDVLEQAA